MTDLHKIWGHRWISPKIKALESKIHGWGVRAIKDIQKGEIVVVIGGVIVPRSEIDKYREKMEHLGIQIDDNFFIVPTSKEEKKETAIPNHSCDPNLGIKDTIKYVAIRDIKAGEELVVDYAFMESYFKPFICNCGAANCRKIIKPDDWKRPEIREKYGRYFSPYLKKKFV